jgi:hypothetical protein
MLFSSRATRLLDHFAHFLVVKTGKFGKICTNRASCPRKFARFAQSAAA